MLMKDKDMVMNFTSLLLMTMVTVTGVKGNILEKHTGLSKATDAVSAVNSPQKIYYKDYIRDFSTNHLC